MNTRNTPQRSTGLGTAERPTATSTRKRRRVSNSRKVIDSSRTDINNLPENFQLTNEILKTNVCRLCATYHESGPKLLPLYETCNGITLSKVVNSLMLTKVCKNDGLPEVVCKKCADQIVAWYKMRMNSIEITRILEIEAEILRSSGGVNSNESRIVTFNIVDLLESSDEETDVPAPAAPLPRLPAAPLLRLPAAVRPPRPAAGAPREHSFPERADLEAMGQMIEALFYRMMR